MIPCYANLIAAELDTIYIAKSFSVEKVKTILRSVGNCVVNPTVQETWSAARFQGTGFSVDSARLIGVSMDIAPVAGIGFCTFAWPTHLSQAAVAEVDVQRYAVRMMAEAAKDQLRLSIAPVMGFISDTDYPFEVSFRRRIAYALGFRASLLAQDATYYDTWFETVISDEVSHLETVGQDKDKIVEFSIVLNLLARLDGTMAYERENGRPHSKVPGRVKDYQAKVCVLEARLKSLVQLIRCNLNEDARFAIQAILHELNAQRHSGIWNVLDSPCWGKKAKSDVFLSEDVDSWSAVE